MPTDIATIANASKSTRERAVDAAARGATLSFRPTREVLDFDEFRDALAIAKRVIIEGRKSDYEHLERLADMAEVEELICGVPLSAKDDLSVLPKLRKADVTGVGAYKVMTCATLEQLVLVGPPPLAELVPSPQLTRLTIVGQRKDWDLAFLERASALEELEIAVTASVDLAGLRLSEGLRSINVRKTKELAGADVLPLLPSLEYVQLERVADVRPPDALRCLRDLQLWVDHCPSISHDDMVAIESNLDGDRGSVQFFTSDVDQSGWDGTSAGLPRRRFAQHMRGSVREVVYVGGLPEELGDPRQAALLIERILRERLPLFLDKERVKINESSIAVECVDELVAQHVAFALNLAWATKRRIDRMRRSID